MPQTKDSLTGMATSARVGVRVRAAPKGIRERRLSISLDVSSASLLEATALDRGASPSEFAASLLTASLVLLQTASRPSARAEVAELRDRLATVEKALGKLGAQPSPSMSKVGKSGSTDRRRLSRESAPRARLHEVIAKVLAESQGPLTSAEIAQRIQGRGLFRPPRSERPVDVLMVASRISHERYRHLFRREAGLVQLVDASTARPKHRLTEK